MSITAAGLAAAIKTAQGPAFDEAIQDDYNMKLATGIVTYLQANLTILLAADAVVTVGSPATQQGPQAPLLLPVSP